MKQKLHGLKKVLLGCSMLITCSLYAQPKMDWAKGIGGGLQNQSDYGVVLTTDASGNVFTVGTFSGTVDFNPGAAIDTFTNNRGYNDFFLLKQDSVGNFIWAKQLVGNVYGACIKVDNAGGIYIGGGFEGTADFDPGTATLDLTASKKVQDAFLLKLNEKGDLLWVKQFGGIGGYTSISGMGLDKSGFLYCGGDFKGSVDFDPSSKTSFLDPNGAYDVFVSKFDTAGNFFWVKNLGGLKDDQLRGLDIDSSGNIYTIGDFREMADFDPGPGTAYLTAGKAGYTFISKLNASGDFVWARQLNDGVYTVKDIAVDAQGNSYTTGKLETLSGLPTMDLDPGPGEALFGGNNGHYILKLDAEGYFVWAKQFARVNAANAIAVDAASNVYTTGYLYDSTADFNPDTTLKYNLKPKEGYTYVVKLNSTGNLIWALNMGANNEKPDYTASPNNLYVDRTGRVYTLGTFYGTVDLEPGPGVSNVSVAGAGKRNQGTGVFIHKMSCPVVIENIALTECISYDFYGATLRQSGTYTHAFSNVAAGCDSIISLALTIPIIDASVTKNESTLTATATNSTYQWIDCANGHATISGQTQQQFTPSKDGSYAVIVSIGTCSDTSECFTVKIPTVNISDPDAYSALQLYPNPTANQFVLSTGKEIQKGTLNLVNTTGQRIMQRKGMKGHLFTIDITAYPPGIYMVELTEQGQTTRTKLVKQ